MGESFAPSIRTSCGDITPKGYEWILGFALHGCQWAIDEALKPEFKQLVLDEQIKAAKSWRVNHIKDLETTIKKLYDEIEHLDQRQ